MSYCAKCNSEFKKPAEKLLLCPECKKNGLTSIVVAERPKSKMPSGVHGLLAAMIGMVIVSTFMDATQRTNKNLDATQRTNKNQWTRRKGKWRLKK